MPVIEDRLLPDRVMDRSWVKAPVGTQALPQEYLAGLYGLDHAVRVALGGDWTPEDIRTGVDQLLRSYAPEAAAMTEEDRRA